MKLYRLRVEIIKTLANRQNNEPMSVQSISSEIDSTYSGTYRATQFLVYRKLIDQTKKEGYNARDGLGLKANQKTYTIAKALREIEEAIGEKIT